MGGEKGGRRREEDQGPFADQRHNRKRNLAEGKGPVPRRGYLGRVQRGERKRGGGGEKEEKGAWSPIRRCPTLRGQSQKIERRGEGRREGERKGKRKGAGSPDAKKKQNTYVIPVLLKRGRKERGKGGKGGGEHTRGFESREWLILSIIKKKERGGRRGRRGECNIGFALGDFCIPTLSIFPISNDTWREERERKENGGGKKVKKNDQAKWLGSPQISGNEKEKRGKREKGRRRNTGPGSGWPEVVGFMQPVERGKEKKRKRREERKRVDMWCDYWFGWKREEGGKEKKRERPWTIATPLLTGR